MEMLDSPIIIVIKPLTPTERSKVRRVIDKLIK